jgi:hypothetical protein
MAFRTLMAPLEHLRLFSMDFTQPSELLALIGAAQSLVTLELADIWFALLNRWQDVLLVSKKNEDSGFLHYPLSSWLRIAFGTYSDLRKEEAKAPPNLKNEEFAGGLGAETKLDGVVCVIDGVFGQEVKDTISFIFNMFTFSLRKRTQTTLLTPVVSSRYRPFIQSLLTWS